MAVDTATLQQFIKSFITSLPPGIAFVQEELEKALQAFFLQACTKWGLVTQQEFEIQMQVLAKTRLKLEELEKRLNTLQPPL